MIIKSQELKGKTKLTIYKSISNYYDNMNIRFDEHAFVKNAQVINELYHEKLLLKKFQQTKPQVKNMNINYYDLYNTVIKKGEEEEQYDNDYINFNDFITPNNYIGIKNDNVKLR